ncbi:MAG: DUF1501 domain-containing protein [Verrucomicrobiota bacterium]
MNRRQFLQTSSLGFGWFGLQHLANATAIPPHFPAKAKSVILCYMSGGVSHVDSFDPKPLLTEMAGKPMPMPVKATMFNNVGTIMPSPWEFKNRGQSGMPVSELFPHIAKLADDLCLVRSMTSKASEHAQGNFHFHSGFSFQGHPSAGAWMSYGLGSENDNLPGYVVLRSGGATDPIGGSGVYSNGFLPAQHQPSFLTVDRDPALPNLKPANSAEAQLKEIAAMRKFDTRFNADLGQIGEIEAAIGNYETAFRMQSAVPDVCDIRGESEATKKLYGVDSSNPEQAAYARQCLTARRLVERGVRFVELSCLAGSGKHDSPPINPWDQHGQLKEGHADMAHQVDQPIAALLTDLKARGLLESTIVIFSGEFGRTPFAQGTNGRDHNPYGFSLWVAGGGFKGGLIHGATDDFGYHAVESPVSVYDLWATVQHQLGIRHEDLTYLFGGRYFRLSDIEGRIVKPLIS